MEHLVRILKTIVGEEYLYINEPMNKHCTFRCGGCAAVYVVPGTMKEVIEVIGACRKYDWDFEVIGNGSNLLIRDTGYPGVIVEIGSRVSNIDVIGEEIEVEAGAKLSLTATVAMENDLAGMEFAHGIPGNIGGAVAMNAGAYGGDMSQIVQLVTILDADNTVKTLDVSQLKFGYRTSIIQEKKYVVLKVRLKLNIGNAGDIASVMHFLMQQRRLKQPLEYPSAGSTFKKPEGFFAGKLIEDAGLKGYCVGGAKVSDKHCGFLINYDNATATDIIRLIEDVQCRVQETAGVFLEPEIRIL